MMPFSGIALITIVEGIAVQIRTALLSVFLELDNGVHDGVPVDVLLGRAQKRQFTAEDFFIALTSAIHDGDLVESSPGLVSLTALGAKHYKGLLSTS